MEKKMLNKIRYELGKENLFLKTITDAFGVKKYIVFDSNNVLQSSETGMTLEELATYAEVPWVE